MPETAQIARKLRIRGHVQGVGYRAGALAAGQRLGLRGWVRNRHDGSVEALVAGPDIAVEQFIAWAHKGPTHSQVVEVETTSVEASADTTFVVLPTA